MVVCAEEKAVASHGGGVNSLTYRGKLRCFEESKCVPLGWARQQSWPGSSTGAVAESAAARC